MGLSVMLLHVAPTCERFAAHVTRVIPGRAVDLHVALEPVQEHVGKAALVALVARLGNASLLLGGVHIQAVSFERQRVDKTCATVLAEVGLLLAVGLHVMLQVARVEEHLGAQGTAEGALFDMILVAMLPHGSATGVHESAQLAAEAVVVEVLEEGVDAGLGVVLTSDVQLEHEDVAEAAETLLTSVFRVCLAHTHTPAPGGPILVRRLIFVSVLRSTGPLFCSLCHDCWFCLWASFWLPFILWLFFEAAGGIFHGL